MNNIEELNNKARIERLKSKFEIAKSYGSDQLTVPMPDLEALIAQLEAKNIRADACVNAFDGIETERFAGKSIGEFLTGEVRLNKAEPKSDGSFGFTFSGVAIQIMAEAFADQFKSSGAVNYLELLFDHSEVGPLTVTMQRVEGLTPAQKLAAVEAQLEAAQKESAIRLEAIEQMRKTVAHNVERAQTAEAALSAENEKLKGYQVPVGLIKRKTPLLSDGAFRYSFISDVNLPFDTELFTAPQKLSDLPYDIVFNAIAKATNIQGQAISISVKEFKAAIKAAGGTVEE